ncbi:MAG: hypothetical protein K8F91_16665 [Candidatus Obscuribacterales bacterium]|nr:hypothetical protein [Candidatus Obscuribacterales bacterium]
MADVKTEKYLIYCLQVLKGLQDDMETLTDHDAKADPEIVEEILDEIISRCLVPALQQLGIEDPLAEILEEIDPSDIFEAELDRLTDEVDIEEEEEEEELVGAH